MRFSRRYELSVWPDNRPVHVVVPARFEHKAFADVVILVLGLITLLKEGSLERGKARVDYAGWFARGVHVDAFYGLPS